MCYKLQALKAEHKMCKSTQRVQTPPRPKCQPKVIRNSSPDFQINPVPDPDFCRITSKMLWIINLSASVISQVS